MPVKVILYYTTAKGVIHTLLIYAHFWIQTTIRFSTRFLSHILYPKDRSNGIVTHTAVKVNIFVLSKNE